MIERIGLRSIMNGFRLQPGNVIVVALQVVIAMTVICNALHIALNRVAHVQQPSGLRETHLLSVRSSKVDGSKQSTEQRAAAIQEDLTRLRAIPGALAVTETFSLPLSGLAQGGGVAITSPSEENRPVSYFFADTAALDTLGLRLIAGRNFEPEEIMAGDSVSNGTGPVIVTDALATRLYGSPGTALGKPLFLNGGTTSRVIIGVIDRMEIPNVHAEDTLANWYTVLVPIRYTGDEVNYVVRSSSDDMSGFKARIVSTLLQTDPTRVIDNEDVLTFEQIREAAFGPDLATAKIMLSIVAVLIVITSAGIYGLVSSWIRRRSRSIGIRRALGATRSDIIVYLQVENLLIALPSAVIGGALALYASSWLMQFIAGGQLPLIYAVWGGLIVIAVSQIAVFLPSQLAAKVSPAIVIRRFG